MSITITGGITFSYIGGVSIIAPLPTPTAGWFVGGNPIISTVQRITYATDTSASSVRGPLSQPLQTIGGAGTSDYGWFGGGLASAPTNEISTVQRITYATDTDTPVARGALSLARQRPAATGNTTDGWWAGGYIQGSGPLSLIDRVTYATDTATASVRGPLNDSMYYVSGTGTITLVYGWYYGGRHNIPIPAINTSRVQRITYATDTSTASIRGPLSQQTVGAGSTGNTTDAWISTGTGAASTVERITFATDTATASVRGPLTAVSYKVSATGSDTYGYFAGLANTSRSTVNRITFANDTVTATSVGALTMGAQSMGATTGVQ